MKSPIKQHSLIFCGLFAALILFFSAVNAAAQTENKNVTAANQLTADENFDLHITEEKITETSFARSTNVELSDASRTGLRLEVGVGVRAEKIDATLRGIFGRVRFRASLEPLSRRIRQNSPANEIAAPQKPLP